MELNFTIYQLFYLGLRFTPFVFITFLTAMMIFNRDIRVMIFLAGYIITSIMTIKLGNMISILSAVFVTFDPKNEITCNTMNLSSNLPISFFPLSLILYSYAIFYYICIVLKQPKASRDIILLDNMGILVFLVVVTCLESIWLLIFCTFWWKIMASLFIGGISGLVWSYFISNTRLAIYQHQTVSKGTCKMIYPNVFQCH